MIKKCREEVGNIRNFTPRTCPAWSIKCLRPASNRWLLIDWLVCFGWLFWNRASGSFSTRLNFSDARLDGQCGETNTQPLMSAFTDGIIPQRSKNKEKSAVRRYFQRVTVFRRFAEAALNWSRPKRAECEKSYPTKPYNCAYRNHKTLAELYTKLHGTQKKIIKKYKSWNMY